MPRKRRWIRWFAGALAAVALAAFAAGFAFRDRLMAWGTAPSASFAEMAKVPLPVYLFPEGWHARPDFASRAQLVPEGHGPAAGPEATVDVFYIHPDAYWGDTWNARADDPDLEALVAGPLLAAEATAFNDCCRVFAPRYRTVHGNALDRHSADGQSALDLASADIDRAFDHFFNYDRPIRRPYILVGHGQGAVLAMRLLERRIDNHANMFDKLIAVYLIGVGVPLERFDGTWNRIALCEGPTDTRCVVSFEAFAAGGDPSAEPNVRQIWYDRHWVRLDQVETNCTNPLTWRRDDDPAPRDSNLGALLLEPDYDAGAAHRGTPRIDPSRHDALPAPTVGFAGAQCRDGKLIVSLPEESPVRGFGAGGVNLDQHAVALFWANLRENAAARAAAFLAPEG